MIQDHNRLQVIYAHQKELVAKEVNSCFNAAFAVLTEKQQAIVKSKAQQFYNNCEQWEFAES